MWFLVFENIFSEGCIGVVYPGRNLESVFKKYFFKEVNAALFGQERRSTLGREPRPEPFSGFMLPILER